MRVLIAAREVAERTGAELYVAEVATGLHDRGHEVAVFAPTLGPLADGLRDLGIRIVDRLTSLEPAPDVVLGQGPLPVAATQARFPLVPMMVVGHGHTELWPRRVLADPSVRHVAGVSRVCVRSLLEQGAPPSLTHLLPNFVDTDRFGRRAPLPRRPARVLLFSNYATPGGYVTAVRSACDAAGLHLDVVGAGMGSSHTDPGALLGTYDIVLGKGRAALEAAAVGCAVVLCDFAGVGPMVTPESFDELRAMNFGFEALTETHGAAAVTAQLARYDPDASAVVCERLRSEASLHGYLSDLQVLLGTLAAQGAEQGRRSISARSIAVMRFAALRSYWALPARPRVALRDTLNPLRHRLLQRWRGLGLRRKRRG